ncbi:hypothetical protein AS589_09450 [Empedobacter brevis]|uniref:hypothetical protein n=1 Tax=Empedobacter brevis TaxID=247 RepID=UPI00131FA6FF|nr:hypothetical protein [Empedobacter brevis]QHC84980.1 hypothetical protein AS589_09450 [Empedobacter brevis]
MTIYEFIDIVEDMPSNWIELNVQKFVHDNQDMIFSFIENQWELGENEDGQAVGYYKPVTENFYAKISRPLLSKRTGQPYNLIWSGSLFKELHIETKFSNNGNIILIDSSSNSKTKLFAQIKEENLINDPYSIFGLNEKHNSQLNQYIEDNLIENFKELLNL